MISSVKNFGIGLLLLCTVMASPAYAANGSSLQPVLIVITFAILLLVIGVLFITVLTKNMVKTYFKRNNRKDTKDYSEYLKDLNSNQISIFLKSQDNKAKISLVAILLLSMSAINAFGQNQQPVTEASLLSEKGIIITITLLLIPIIAGFVFMVLKISRSLNNYRNVQDLKEAERLTDYLINYEEDGITTILEKRKQALDYTLANNELSGTLPAEDHKGLISSVDHEASLPFVARKKRGSGRPKIDSELSNLVIWFIGCATFWLVFGTTIGEYLGIKFVAPDVDTVSWLSFGRLRPVHTNAVFWGWASLAMLGLGYYVVPRVSNTRLYSFQMGWYTLILINTSVVIGSICLMAGINNGGGEYREYIWPVMLLFAIGLVLTLYNFIKTIATRTTKEIYISNWYIVSSIIFAIVITLVAYIPLWQNGLGETIVQGYYMHQGVGMWFMLFTLGIVYYFLPQQLNKPIYSYSLGILAFWTQILFYTLIGSHHFVFSSIPWWLQTVAIVGSVGMVIPVLAGTTNFLLTFNGAWYKIKDSYTLPFFLTGIIFYFTGSLQGTAEAFRSTNLIWHFTDFTVAHSHLTMYGIICFFLWAAIYAVMPRLTGQEAPQVTMGAHFWLALIGMLFYTVPLMYGSTLRGVMWMEGKPFIDSVVFMAPFWLWRAIGGSLMWLSHLFFAYNLYRMMHISSRVDIKEVAFEHLQTQSDTESPANK